VFPEKDKVKNYNADVVLVLILGKINKHDNKIIMPRGVSKELPFRLACTTCARDE
jgi:hypothetical protein